MTFLTRIRAFFKKLRKFITNSWNYGDDQLRQLPLQLLGFRNVPAIPFSISATFQSLAGITGRIQELRPSLNGLNVIYNIQGNESTAYSFLFGKNTTTTKIVEELNLLSSVLAKHARNVVKGLIRSSGSKKEALNKIRYDHLVAERPLTNLSLETPEQFSLSWSTFWNLHRDADEHALEGYTKNLIDPDYASDQLYEQLSKNYGFNTLLFKKVTADNIEGFKSDFSDYWTEEMDALYADELLYVIDYRIFNKMQTELENDQVRFTPATFTFLRQDPQTKKLSAFAVQVSGYKDAGLQFYYKDKATSSAWLYALQAVRTCTCVYGIFIGHLYYWHIPTAALIMTMESDLPKDHPVRRVMEPQSQFIIGWDNLLMIGWDAIAPPTSLTSPLKWVELLDIFTEGRTFFDDDPLNTLQQLGIKEADFTHEKPWDRYPIAGYFLEIWEATDRYVTHCIHVSYPSDEAVAKDEKLQKWMKTSGARLGGNVRGLPEMNSRANLIAVLCSFIYRITVHGGTRMNNYIHPGQSFIANYPPNLKSMHIPEPSSDFSTQELISYLPTTGEIGDMVIFYYTFGNTSPYESFVPLTGVDTNLYFEGENAEELNKGLMTFREDLKTFMRRFNKELKIPNMAPNQLQYQQWPLNIET